MIVAKAHGGARMDLLLSTRRDEEIDPYAQASLAGAMLAYDNQHKPVNYILIGIEVALIAFLIIYTIKNFPKWSKRSISPMQRIGLLCIACGSLTFLGTLVDWSIKTERPLVYLSKQWSSSYEPNYPKPKDTSKDSEYLPKEQWNYKYEWKQSLFSKRGISYNSYKQYGQWWMLSAILLLCGIIMYKGFADKFYKWIIFGK